MTDRDLIARWHSELYSAADRSEWLTLFAIRRTDGNSQTRWAPTTDIDMFVDQAHELTDDGYCVWHGVATRKQRGADRTRGTAKECSAIPGLWVDIDIDGPNHAADNLAPDIDTALDVVARYPHAPTYTIHTGGGLQAWWLFDHLFDGLYDDNPQRLLDRWRWTWDKIGADAGYQIDNVYDLPRIMRLPGTHNTKQAEPQPVTILDDTGRRYDPDALHYDEPPPPAPTPVSTYSGNETRPGDDYNRTPDAAAAQLEKLGFHTPTLAGDRIDYTRPGKEARHGHSASIYADDGHITIWSDTTAALYDGIDAGDAMFPFELYCRTEHGGDFTAAAAALRSQGYGAQAPQAPWVDLHATTTHQDVVDDDRAIRPVEWQALYGGEHNEEWLIEPIIPAGRSVALVASAKAGKSLLALYLVACVSAGRDPFTGKTTTPRSTVYLDFEMGEYDLLERLEDMGFEPDDLTNLHYYLNPPIPPMDTSQGGQVAAELAERHDADLIVFDTASRIVEGEESSADTWQNLYRCTYLPLKRRGMSIVRLDHLGKDIKKGARGSSAKGDDVDVVWVLDVEGARVTVRRERARISWVQPYVALELRDDPLRYHQKSETAPAGVAAKVTELDEVGAPDDISVTDARKTLKAAGLKGGKQEVLSAAVRYRKHHRVTPPDPKNVGHTAYKKRDPFEGNGTPEKALPDERVTEGHDADEQDISAGQPPQTER